MAGTRVGCSSSPHSPSSLLSYSFRFLLSCFPPRSQFAIGYNPCFRSIASNFLIPYSLNPRSTTHSAMSTYSSIVLIFMILSRLITPYFMTIIAHSLCSVTSTQIHPLPALLIRTYCIHTALPNKDNYQLYQ
jgi:hypothetical protein